jgi:hypothetical protein
MAARARHHIVSAGWHYSNMSTNQRNFDELAERSRLLRAGGATYKQIKAELGIGSSTTISRMLGVAGTGPPRPRLTPEIRERARGLRRSGRSVPEISRELGIARSTAWVVTKDIAWAPGPDSAARRAEAGRRYWRTRNAQRDQERVKAHAAAAAEVGGLSDRELLLLGTVLNWAEGSKSKRWSRREQLELINSDPDVIRLFLAWLKLLGVTADRLHYRVHIHESADVDGAERFWAGAVGISRDSLAPATLKRHNPKTARKNTGDAYGGCLAIRVRRSAAQYWRMHGLWLAIFAALREANWPAAPS